MASSFPSNGASPLCVAKKIKHSMQKDIVPSKNLGSFITTSHDAEATLMMAANFHKNQACVEEYASVSKYQQECISMIADLWGRQPSDNPFGTATTGSSEAVMLAGLAMKRAHQERAPSSNRRLNIVVGSNAHACVFKFAAYFELETRVVPVTAGSNYVFDARQLEDRLDGDTVGVFLTLGSTYTGHYDPILEVSNQLDAYQARTGINLPIHVDAASGGFVAPFTPDAEDFVWDFRIRRVQSINASGHKFGFAPCAIGWLVWRDISCLPPSLLVESTYLRGAQTAFTLSFSRSCAPVLVQYLSFLRLGREGYTRKIGSLLSAAELWSWRLEQTGYFSCVSPLAQSSDRKNHSGGQNHHMRCQVCPSYQNHERNWPSFGLPVIVFTLSSDFHERFPWVKLEEVGDLMFERGFAVPHYTLKGSEGEEDAHVLRIVMREDTRLEMESVYTHLVEIVHGLKNSPGGRSVSFPREEGVLEF